AKRTIARRWAARPTAWTSMKSASSESAKKIVPNPCCTASLNRIEGVPREGGVVAWMGRVAAAVRSHQRREERKGDHGREEERDRRNPHEGHVEGCAGHPDEEEVQGPRRPEDPGLHLPDHEDEADEAQERDGQGDDVEECAALDPGLQYLDGALSKP